MPHLTGVAWLSRTARLRRTQRRGRRPQPPPPDQSRQIRAAPQVTAHATSEPHPTSEPLPRVEPPPRSAPYPHQSHTPRRPSRLQTSRRIRPARPKQPEGSARGSEPQCLSTARQRDKATGPRHPAAPSPGRSPSLETTPERKRRQPTALVAQSHKRCLLTLVSAGGGVVDRLRAPPDGARRARPDPASYG